MPSSTYDRQAAYRKRKADQIKRFSTYIPVPVLDAARAQSVSAGVSFPAYLLAALHHFQASPMSKDGTAILNLAKAIGAPFDYAPHARHKKTGEAE